MYTHLGGGDMRAVYESQQSSEPSVFVDRALEVIAKGYTAVKGEIYHSARQNLSTVSRPTDMRNAPWKLYAWQ